jgi:hypothetical protein
MSLSDLCPEYSMTSPVLGLSFGMSLSVLGQNLRMSLSLLGHVFV